MTTKTQRPSAPELGTAPAKTLADVLVAVERNNAPVHRRRRAICAQR